MLCGICFFQRPRFGDPLGCGRPAHSLGLRLATSRIRLRHGGFGFVFTGDGGGVRLRHLNTLILDRLRFTDRTVAILFGNRLFRIVDRLGGRLFTQRFDIPRLVGDIGHIHVDQPQTDLFQFGFHIVVHRFHKLVAVGIDLFNIHGRNDQTQLTEDDVLRQLLHLNHFQPQQPLGGVLHSTRLGGDPHRKPRGHIHADVLVRQRVGQIHVDGNGGQIQIIKRLDHRPDERRATVDTPCRARRPVFVGADFTVDDHNFVGRAPAVPRQQHQQQRKQQHPDHDQQDNNIARHTNSFFLSVFILRPTDEPLTHFDSSHRSP